MKEKIMLYRYWLMGAGLALILVLILILKLSFPKTETQDDLMQEWLDSSEKLDEVSESAVEDSSATMYVDVKGAVQSPGIYPIETDMRVWNVLELAGGMTDQADEKQINLSQKVEDQMVVYVPEIGEAPVEPLVETNIKENDSEKIDLNTATEQELMTLSGIGQKKAQEIINYRETQGRFSSIEELTAISGFGEKTLEKIRTLIYVS